MIAVDTNILVYAFFRQQTNHLAAYEALREVAEAPERWAIPWPCVHEFLAVTTNPRIYTPVAAPADAMTAVRSWSQNLHCAFLSESPGYLDILLELLDSSQVRGGAIHDARIAALCLHHGVRELWTADRDFSRFPRLKTRNPLVRR
jgi:toxin-antitoxin system PIN domain toxin